MAESGESSILGEFEHVSLGDKRLDRRLLKLASAMERAPEESFVEQAEDIAALEATYRFLSNARVSPEKVFGGHVARTVARAAHHDTVLILHDTTEFRFGGTKERRGLGRVSNKKREGFLSHYSLCVSEKGDPLGCIDMLAWSRLDQEKRPKAKGTLLDPDRESLRWLEAAERTSERLHGRCSPIHVMDREGDQFGLFATLAADNERFVVRLGHDRRLRKGRGRDGFPMLNEHLSQGPSRFVRQVHLGRRERERATKKQNIFPERTARDAVLEVRAKRIELHRAHQHAEHLPQFVTLNFVEAREVGAPPGMAPVIWRLVTTEPIDTDSQVGKVIDVYRKRWLIEEFFKAIKTGCRFEAHQLEDIRGLLVALAIESTIAWRLLRLRYLDRECPDASGETILSEEQRHTLCHIRAQRGIASQSLTVRDVTSELAALGSHIKNNGPPGWLVMKRGLRKLDLLAQGLTLAFRSPGLPELVINL